MRQSPRCLAIMAPLLLTAQAAPPQATETSWYAIAAENGERVGYGSREIFDTPEGRQVIDFSHEVAPDLWRRYLALLLDGLRSDRRPLPLAPLGPDQLNCAIAKHRH